MADTCTNGLDLCTLYKMDPQNLIDSKFIIDYLNYLSDNTDTYFFETVMTQKETSIRPPYSFSYFRKTKIIK